MKILITLLLLLVPAFLSAEYRIATVDVNKVLNESDEAQEVKSDIDKRSNAAKEKLEARRKQLKDKEDRLIAKKVQQDSKEAESFRAELREFSREVKDTEEELKKKFLKTNKSLADKSLKIISDYAKENKIDLVLDKSESSRGPVLFGTSTVDITDEIVARIND